jgi:hypothetical protein
LRATSTIVTLEEEDCFAIIGNVYIDFIVFAFDLTIPAKLEGFSGNKARFIMLNL